MSLSRIIMRLAPNPGTEFLKGDDRRGYTLVAPIDEAGHLDDAAFQRERDACTVRRFAPEEDAQEGRLSRRGDNWFFDYAEGTDDDEAVYRLGQHSFSVGEYVSIADEDGRLLAYRVTEVQPL